MVWSHKRTRIPGATLSGPTLEQMELRSVAAIGVPPGRRSQGSQPSKRAAGHLIVAQGWPAHFMRTLRRAGCRSIATLRGAGRDCARWRSGSAVDDPDASLHLSARSALRAWCGSALSCWRVRAADAATPRIHRAFVRTSRGVVDMPAWLSLLCGVAVLVAAAYLLYVVLRPEDF